MKNPARLSTLFAIAAAAMLHQAAAPTIMAAFLWAPAAAQDKPQGLKDDEIEKLSKLLIELRSQPQYTSSSREQRAKQKAEEAWKEELEKLQKAYEPTNILSFVDSWSAVFQASNNDARKRTPAGRGRVSKGEKVFWRYQGRDLGVEYALYLPSRFRNDEKWPLILALHDEGGNGADYLDTVWADRKLDKDLFDQFIIVAPTIGEKTLPRDARDAKYQMRIEPFDRWHAFSITLAVMDVLKNYNVDTDRVYVDGTGFGGETAAWLAIMQPKMFAAASVRTAIPCNRKSFSRLELLKNLKNQCPLMICDRKDGVLTTNEGKVVKQQIEHYKEVDGLPIELKDGYEPIDERTLRVVLRDTEGQQDPIVDAMPDIAKFFLSKTRSQYPAELSYATYDISLFKKASWFSLDIGLATPEESTIASLAGSVDRSTNTISFKTPQNVDSFRVLLNDKLVDLDKEVKIVLDGKEVQVEKKERSLDYMLRFLDDTLWLDPQQVWVGDIRVNVPAADQAGNGDEKPAGDEGRGASKDGDRK